MSQSGKIKELYRFTVSTRFIGYLGIYILCLSYIGDHRKYSIYRVLRHI